MPLSGFSISLYVRVCVWSAMATAGAGARVFA